MRFLIHLFLMVFFGFKACWGEPIKVGVLEGPPFAMKFGKTYSGISIDIWDEIAIGLKRPYVFVEPSYTDYDKPFEDLKNGKIDVLIGPISVTYDRYISGDYTIPYFIDKVIAVTPSNHWHNALHLVKMFFLSVGFILIILFFVFFSYINLLWYYERSHTPKVSKNYWKGMSFVFWVHILSGHHDEVPRSTQGKLLMLFHNMAFYMVLIVLNATIISFLAVSFSIYASPVQNLSDLEKIKAGATKDSKSLKLANTLGIRILPFNSILDGLKAVEDGQIGAFLTDLSLADYYINQYQISDLNISHFTLKYDLYVFLTSKENPLLREINEQMLLIRAKGIPHKICNGYLTKGVQNCDL